MITSMLQTGAINESRYLILLECSNQHLVRLAFQVLTMLTLCSHQVWQLTHQVSSMLAIQIISEVTSSTTGGALKHIGDDPPPSRIKPSFGGVGTMIFPDGLTLDNKV